MDSSSFGRNFDDQGRYYLLLSEFEEFSTMFFSPTQISQEENTPLLEGFKGGNGPSSRLAEGSRHADKAAYILRSLDMDGNDSCLSLTGRRKQLTKYISHPPPHY